MIIGDPTFAPVDRVAVRVLMKAPWWAHFDEPAKVAVIKAKPRIRIEELIDVCSAPPPEVNDHRGEQFGEYVVLGFADQYRRTGTKPHPKNPPAWFVGPKEEWGAGRPRPQTNAKRRWWWCCHVPTGEIERKEWRKLNGSASRQRHAARQRRREAKAASELVREANV